MKILRRDLWVIDVIDDACCLAVKWFWVGLVICVCIPENVVVHDIVRQPRSLGNSQYCQTVVRSGRRFSSKTGTSSSKDANVQ